MDRVAILLLLLAVSVPGCTAAPVAPLTAREQIDRQDYAGALKTAEAALLKNPLDAWAWRERWECRFVLEKGSEAVKKEILREATALLNKHPENKSLLCAVISGFDHAGVNTDRPKALGLLVDQFGSSPEVLFRAQRILSGLLLQSDAKNIEAYHKFFGDYFAKTSAIGGVAMFDIGVKFSKDPVQLGPNTAAAYAQAYPQNRVIAANRTKLLGLYNHPSVIPVGLAAYEMIQIAPGDLPADTFERNRSSFIVATALAQAYRRGNNHKKAQEWINTGTKLLGRFGRPTDTPSALFYQFGAIGSFHLIAGQIAQETGRADAAFRHYAQVAGASGISADLRTGAEQRMQALLKAAKKKPSEMRSVARTLLGRNVPHFTEVSKKVGLRAHKANATSWSSNRASFADYDNDGDPDILSEGQILFRNDGGRFVNVTAESGIDFPKGIAGVFADYDNDGFLDFYGLSGDLDGGGERLYHNRGDGTFEDVSEKAGRPEGIHIVDSASWCDIDGDGYLDLFVPSAPWGHHAGHGWIPMRTRDFLFHNNRDGTFTDIAEKVGFTESQTRYASRDASFADYDNDGDPDLYVSRYSLHANALWENNGKGIFRDVGRERDVIGTSLTHDAMDEPRYGHSSGALWGDLDNDGWLDLLNLNLAHPRDIDISDMSFLYRNPGAKGGPFEDITEKAGITYVETHAGGVMADFDNDGDLDIYTTAYYANRPTQLYLNDGKAHFIEAAWLSGTQVDSTWSAAAADFDGDGDLDLMVTGASGMHLFRNDTEGGHFLRIKPIGTHCNRSAIGARITIETAAGKQIREIRSATSLGLSSELIAHFGLGTETNVSQVTVRFPCGKTVVRKNVKANQSLTITEP